mmetsp:Transcript_39115/g.94555  ORF Transcript_39115/g.94555 Transcript_39115/m.94555 type:complete len:90 (+) Transcript_39115:39-308(+)
MLDDGASSQLQGWSISLLAVFTAERSSILTWLGVAKHDNSFIHSNVQKLRFKTSFVPATVAGSIGQSRNESSRLLFTHQCCQNAAWLLF